MPKVRTKDLIEQFQLELISGEEGIHRPIDTSDLSRPGIEMAGFFTYYPADRVQLLGKTELTFFDTLTSDQKQERMKALCTEETPCIIVTRNQDVPDELLQASRES
ncbi:HPr(Ser) kinase/phosphatase, partial [Vibrio parahaemolyticus]|nr:HPr(Ser) kinase/phosphatase [Vibrio parahaemolyticus]